MRLAHIFDDTAYKRRKLGGLRGTSRRQSYLTVSTEYLLVGKV